ncbi:MAG: sigma-70 family RNA polymerase sigma factor [Firmicutes bacterium]|nr:sigma-70 family RNA polymerase sigma factor [Bacillota bacterium]
MTFRDSKPAIEEVVSTYRGLVSSICRRMIQNPEAVKDAEQEVWLEVVRSYPSFRGESRVSTWVYTITSRVVMDYARKERLHTSRFLRDYFHAGEAELLSYPDFDQKIWVKEMCDKCLTGVLRCLDQESRLAYVFRDIAQLPYGEISEVLGREEAAVRKIVSRARRKLQGFLKDECVLNNPSARCRCRMNRWVTQVNLPEEYERLKKTVYRLNFYRASEMVLPRKEFWEKFI